MQAAISSSFIWRRVHSLAGFWLTLYLSFHLCINSQLSLWLDRDGQRFVRLVDMLASTPFLSLLEWVLIGFPLLVHIVWGIFRLVGAKENTFRTDGSSPSLPRYERNWAYTLQRISSWILMLGIVLHVVQMKFLERPEFISSPTGGQWVAYVSCDESLGTLAERLQVRVQLLEGDRAKIFAPNKGTALLFIMRNIFKSPWQVFFYSLFVLAASFHACNGFWTFLVTWGLLLSFRSQRRMIPVGVLWMAFLVFLGFTAIWGSYLS